MLIASSLDLAAFTLAAALAEDADPIVPVRQQHDRRYYME
jgi:hypothetical protein